MKVLVTGANGHLGANIVRELLNRPYEVVAFVRQTSDLRGLDGLNVTLAYGDVLNADSFKKAAEGCDVIIHTAAVFKWWVKDASVIAETAIEGTKNLFAAAKHANIKRVVYTSSVVAIGTTTDPNQKLTANDWNESPHTDYAEAKVLSEKEAWRLSKEAGIPMIVLNPGAIFGPHDYRITPSMGILLGMADGSGSTFNSGIGLVDVRDVAAIHALAVKLGEPGQRYAIVGHNLHFLEFGQRVVEFTGKKIGHFNPPKIIANAVASLMEFIARFTGKEPLITRAMLEDYNGRYQYIDASNTYKTFNYTPRPLQQTIFDSLQWLIKIKALAPIETKQYSQTMAEA